VLPSPACARALQTVVDTLEKHGHEVVTMYDPPHLALDSLTYSDATVTPRAHMKG
jgi:hypothetical protein